MKLDARRQKLQVHYAHVLILRTILCQVLAAYLYHHLWSETLQNGYSIGVTVRLECEFDLVKKMERVKETHWSNHAMKDHPKEIPKNLQGFASIHISSNLLAKTLLTERRNRQDDKKFFRS